MQTILFFSRLILYLLLVSTPIWLKPAIVVAYDSVSAVAWFVLVPAQMCLAYFLYPSRLKSGRVWLGPLLSLLVSTLLILTFSGLETGAVFLYASLALSSFVLTRLIFFNKGGSFLAACEIFFFGFVYFSFLNFTRSSPEIAREHPLFAKAILFLMVISFLFHAAILYLAAFPDRSLQKKRSELLALSCIFLPAFLLLAFLSPRDFVKHDIAFNEWNEEPPPPKELDSEGGLGRPQEAEKDDHRNGLPLGERDEKYPTELQGGGAKQKNVPEKEQRPEKPEQKQKGGRGKKNKDQEQKKRDRGGRSGSSSGKGSDQGPRLEGVPADQWNNYRNSSGSGQGKKQNAVMVVASKINPVYAAQAYLGTFSSESVLTASLLDLEPLNELAEMQLIETWQDQVRERDDKRKIVPMFFLSTVKQRVSAYRPYRIQPTVQNVIYHPFDLSYHVQSRVSVSQPEDWALAGNLDPSQKKRMEHYLELELPGQMERDFQKHLQRVRRQYQKAKKKHRDTAPERYFEKIDAILRGFAGHRYELGYDEEMNLEKIHIFLKKEKKGDCTEFAFMSALLGRIAGIPSRVVIGYLASRDLQTPAHRGALYHLRDRIPLLKEYAISDLYLVTSAHYHAWVQFWIPYFGWIDFETTSFAIPPKPEMDPNNMDVVIPIIEEEKPFLQPGFVFPWRLVLKIAAALLLALTCGLYFYRYGRQTYYWAVSRIGSQEQAVKALQMRMLLWLEREGYPLKQRYRTTLEYSQTLPISPKIREFAELYTMLRFRENYQVGEKKEKYQRLWQSFEESRNTMRSRGWRAALRRIFSLRSLYY